MKKTAFTVSLCFIVLFASAQHFRKIIENKYSIRRTLFKIDTTRQHDASVLHATSVEGVDNVESKSPLEKVLFGNTNAKIEFVVEPSFEGAYGIRVIKDSSETSSSLEVKRIINWKEVEKQMQKAFPVKGYTIQELNAKIAEREKMSEEERELSILKSRIRNEKREKESLKRYQVHTFIIPISDLFAEKLYAKFVSFIDDFKAKDGRRRDDGVPLYRRSGNMDAIDPFQNRRKSTRTVRSVQTNRRRRGSGPIRRVEVYRIVGIRARGLQLRQYKELPGSQAYCKFSFNKTVKISISSHKKQDGIVLR